MTEVNLISQNCFVLTWLPGVLYLASCLNFSITRDTLSWNLLGTSKVANWSTLKPLSVLRKNCL